MYCCSTKRKSNFLHFIPHAGIHASTHAVYIHNHTGNQSDTIFNGIFQTILQISGLLQPIDERLVKKIQELVSSGVNRVLETQRHLQYYVRKEIFAGRKPPEVINRRFFPTSIDVRNYMCRATV